MKNRAEALDYLRTNYPDNFDLYTKQVESLSDEVFDEYSVDIFSQRLKEERCDQNLSYSKFAKELGMDRSYVYYLENRNAVSNRRIYRSKKRYIKTSSYRFYVLIASIALDVSPLYMIGLTDDRYYEGIYKE